MSDIAGSISAITTSNNQLFIVEDTTKSSISVDGQLANVNMVHISKEDYEQLVVTSSTVSSTLYIVSSDVIDAYGQQISNLAPGTDLSDAVNLEQLSNAISSIQIPTDLSSFTNSPGYLLSIPNTYALKTDIQMSYHQNEHKIVLSSGSNETSVDCSDFIKDGMLSAAELCGTQLVLTFNTDAGSQPISVDLSNFVDNYDDKVTYLSSAISSKITIVDKLANVSAQNANLSVVKLSTSEYEDMIVNGTTLSNCLYIVDNSFVDMYNEQIKYLAPGTDPTDAVNMQQLSSAISDFLSAVPDSYKTYDSILSSLSVDGYALSSQLTSKAETSALPYTLVNAVLNSCTYNNAQCVSCQIEDRTITTLSVDGNTPDVVVFLPQKQNATAARDFILRVEISAATVPGFTFVGAGNETVQYDSEDDEWYVLEPGLNLISFTETK